MGAHSVGFYFSGRKSRYQVSEEFEKLQKKEDRKLKNVPREVMYGRYADLGYIKFEDKLIENEYDAECYCLDRAEKWEYCYAVKTKILKPGAKKRSTVWLVMGWMPE